MFYKSRRTKSWLAGTSPAMTRAWFHPNTSRSEEPNRLSRSGDCKNPDA
jgi:hypothetical protein